MHNICTPSAVQQGIIMYYNPKMFFLSEKIRADFQLDFKQDEG